MRIRWEILFVAPSKGEYPCNISKNIAPSDHMSALTPYFPLKTSGAMVSLVPKMVIRDCSERDSMMRANPISPILNLSCPLKTFSLFMSR